MILRNFTVGFTSGPEGMVVACGEHSPHHTGDDVPKAADSRPTKVGERSNVGGTAMNDQGESMMALPAAGLGAGYSHSISGR
jgi:hypothetical protein